MAEPLELQIIENLKTAVEGISVAAGFFHDVAALAVKLDPDHDVALLIRDTPLRPFFFMTVSISPFKYVEKPNGILLLMNFAIHAVHDTDPTVDDSMLKTYFRLCADIEKAISVDISRGGLATDTKILNGKMHELEGQQVWAEVTGEIREHRTYGKPNG